MPQEKIYVIFPLGDSALTIDFGNIINGKINETILNLFHSLKENPLPGMIEAVPAYSSLSIFYDPVKLKKQGLGKETVYEFVKQEFEKFIEHLPLHEEKPARIVRVPVCYDEEFAPDLDLLAAAKQMDKEEIIHLHCGKQYRVYMIGFLPGFPYMGTVDERITFPRKKDPVNVPAGSVGIAGSQTGIYPFNSPGGWNIIGRTPLKMFDLQREERSLLNAGDSVEFYPVHKNEFLTLLK